MIAVTAKTSPIFAQEPKPALLAQAVQVYLARTRQATAKTKTRSEINRTKKKWFKQKGTGNARHGARTPGIFVGGGVALGPTGLQNYHLKLTTKMKQQALLTALNLQVKNTFVNDDLTQVDGKTKSGVKLLGEHLSDDNRVLIIVDQITPTMYRSFNNLEMVLVTSAKSVNVLTVSRADKIVCNSAALEVLQNRLLTSATKTSAEPSQPVAKAEVKPAPKRSTKPAPKKVAPKKTTTTKAKATTKTKTKVEEK